MSRVHFTGPWRYRLGNYLAAGRIGMATIARRAVGRRTHPAWDLSLEIGTLIVRHQFTRALNMPDIAEGRRYFDAMQPRTDEHYDVGSEVIAAPRGRWVTPARQTRDAVLLYLHGGGYTFHAGVTHRFADMMAAHTGCRVFALDYRLTPEHPDPAQIDDAMAAYRFLLDQIDPSRLVVIGDSAGGHLVLRTLLAARDEGHAQPALAIGLCPWTDIGARGNSLTENDKYDIVQGWMALKFGEWLADGRVAQKREALSPIHHDFKGLAPMYLQGGQCEVLIDMIRDFARKQAGNGARIRLDTWPHMNHDFQAHGRTLPASGEAIDRICAAIDWATAGAEFAPAAVTEVDHM